MNSQGSYPPSFKKKSTNFYLRYFKTIANASFILGICSLLVGLLASTVVQPASANPAPGFGFVDAVTGGVCEKGYVLRDKEEPYEYSGNKRIGYVYVQTRDDDHTCYLYTEDTVDNCFAVKGIGSGDVDVDEVGNRDECERIRAVEFFEEQEPAPETEVPPPTEENTPTATLDVTATEQPVDTPTATATQGIPDTPTSTSTEGPGPQPPVDTATPTNTQAPTSTNTSPPPAPTSTNTSPPPPPTATNTVPPPTFTNTPPPQAPAPTSTNTSPPPTATSTNTSLPPTATLTNTLPPPTATATNTALPPTATLTNTSPPELAEGPYPGPGTATSTLSPGELATLIALGTRSAPGTVSPPGVTETPALIPQTGIDFSGGGIQLLYYQRIFYGLGIGLLGLGLVFRSIANKLNEDEEQDR